MSNDEKYPNSPASVENFQPLTGPFPKSLPGAVSVSRIQPNDRTVFARLAALRRSAADVRHVWRFHSKWEEGLAGNLSVPRIQVQMACKWHGMELMILLDKPNVNKDGPQNHPRRPTFFRAHRISAGRALFAHW